MARSTFVCIPLAVHKCKDIWEMEAQEEEDMGSVNGSPTATFVKLLGKDAQLVNAGEHWVTRVCIPWEDKALCWLFNASGSHQGHI